MTDFSVLFFNISEYFRKATKIISMPPNNSEKKSTLHCGLLCASLLGSIINHSSRSVQKVCTVKLGFKELLNKEQIGFKELFTDYQLFYTINLLLNKELLPI